MRFWDLGLQEIASLVALELVASGEFGRGECEFAVGFDSVVCKKVVTAIKPCRTGRLGL